MTDGQSNAGEIEPLVAADAAKALGVKVYTIGVGTQGEAPVPVYFMGQKTYRMQQVDIDEETLKAIAEKTGGIYYRADNAKRFREIYAEIDRLEKTEAEVKKYTQYRELFGWLIAAGMAMLATQLFLDNTVWRRLP
jgi:Ca-activated chloride channel family protein